MLRAWNVSKYLCQKHKRDEAKLLWLAGDGFVVDDSRIMRVWEDYRPY